MALVSSASSAARQVLGGARPAQPSVVGPRKASFVVRASATPPVKQGANRQLWFASKQSLSYLDGSLPGDFGFDPLGLSDPEGTGGFIEPKWLAYGEIINGRFAMLGAAGAIAPEILGKAGLIPAETALPWFKTGVIPPAGQYPYWADPYTLFVLEMALMGFAEHRRFQDWAKPGSMGKQYFLGFEKFLGGSGDPAYPGGPLFNPLGFGKDDKSMKELKLKEVKNGRLAMLAVLGYFIQGLVTGVGPFQNLLDHLADPEFSGHRLLADDLKTRRELLRGNTLRRPSQCLIQRNIIKKIRRKRRGKLLVRNELVEVRKEGFGNRYEI